MVIDNIMGYVMACNVLKGNYYDNINCSLPRVTCCLADAPLSCKKMDAKNMEQAFHNMVCWYSGPKCISL